MLGVLFLLSTLGILTVNIWGVFWPLILVLVGVWVLMGGLFGPKAPSKEVESVAIPLEGAGRGAIRIKHGAGRLQVNAGAQSDQLASGTFSGGVDYQTERDGETLKLEMRGRGGGWPFAFRSWSSLDWSVSLTDAVELSLALESGANETRLDLTDLKVTDLSLKTGASSTEIILPSGAGHTRARVRAGAAEVKIQVPDGVAARIRAKGGISDISVDKGRFPRSGDTYESSDYETAENKVEIDAEIGVGSLGVK